MQTMDSANDAMLDADARGCDADGFPLPSPEPPSLKARPAEWAAFDAAVDRHIAHRRKADKDRRHPCTNPKHYAIGTDGEWAPCPSSRWVWKGYPEPKASRQVSK